jgi:hypothetical protein
MGAQPSRPDEMKAKQLLSELEASCNEAAQVVKTANVLILCTGAGIYKLLITPHALETSICTTIFNQVSPQILVLPRTTILRRYFVVGSNSKPTDIPCSVLPLCHGRWMRTRTEILRTMTFAFRTGYKRRLTCFMDFGGCASTTIAAQVRYLRVLLAFLLLSSIVLLLSFLVLSTPT